MEKEETKVRVSVVDGYNNRIKGVIITDIPEKLLDEPLEEGDLFQVMEIYDE